LHIMSYFHLKVKKLKRRKKAHSQSYIYVKFLSFSGLIEQSDKTENKLLQYSYTRM